MKPNNTNRCFTLCAAMLTMALYAGCKTSGTTEGQKQIGKLSSELDDFAGVLQDAKNGLRTTIAEHDAIVANQDGDLAAHYKAFSSGVDEAEENRAKIRKHLEEIQATAGPYFAKWQADLAAISDEDLRERSEDRMKDTQKRMEKLRAQGEKAQAAYEPLLVTLKDHRAYLANDLNPSAAGSLSKDSKSVSKHAEELYEILDQVASAAKDYSSSIATRTAVPAATPAN